MADAIDMRIFLKKFFNVHRLHDMQDNDYERWVRFEDFVSKNNMTDNMKKWAGYLEKDAAGNYLREPPKDGFFKIQDYPDIDTLTDEDFERLYLACQTAFDGLKKNRNAYIDETKVYNFINNYYNVFADKSSTSIARSSTEDEITKLAELLENIISNYPGKANELQYLLQTEMKSPLKNFLEDVKNHKYNKDNDFQSVLKNVARTFKKSPYGSTGAANDAIQKLLNDLLKEEKDDTKRSKLESLIKSVKANSIDNEYGAWTEARISEKAKSEFKDKYPDIFKELYKEQKILDAFKQYEGENKQISATIEKTKEDMNYADPKSKDFVAKKREEELTLPQQIQKWASDTYENYLAKYSKFKGDRTFMNASAGEICKAFDKEKIKPIDGLDKVLKTKDAIAKRLQNDVETRDAFDWFAKTLQELKDDPKTSKAFEGALKSGRQLKSLVREIIIMAAEADDPKVTKKAKTALEILSVIKYGNTVSKIMDTIKGDKELFTLLSNKDLSWNKNEGVQFITKAMDKTFRAAFIGFGYGATFLVNNIRKSGSKFNKKYGKDPTGQRMQEASKRWGADHAADKKALENAKQNAETAKAGQEKKRNDAMAAMGMKKHDQLGAKEKSLEKAKEDYGNIDAKVAPVRNQIDSYNNMLTLLDEFDYLDMQKNAVADPEIAKQLAAQQADILKQMYKEHQYDLQELTTYGYDPANNNLRDVLEKQKDKLENDPDYQANVSKLGTLESSIYSRQEAINKYKKATAEIKALDETIEKDNKKINDFDKNHKNVYEELMGYWDFLETGRDLHTGPLYTRRFASSKANQARRLPKVLEAYNKFQSGYHTI